MKHFFTLIAAAMTFMVSGWSQTNTVVDIIVDSPDHETLEAAVIAADLAGTLSGEGPFTVFAPSMMPSRPSTQRRLLECWLTSKR